MCDQLNKQLLYLKNQSRFWFQLLWCELSKIAVSVLELLWIKNWMGKQLSGLLCICGVSFLKVDVILKTSGEKTSICLSAGYYMHENALLRG